MSTKKYQRFGKYLILDHLVDGGMAKICRARFLGDQANRIVVIKMVQSQYSNDASFVKMFQDELNITFGMQHPNITQVYDYGKVNGQLYTAMEYVHGANLKQYLDRLKDRKLVFPVEITCYIISQASQGLFYAHNLTDKLSGKKFNIIHRDISPHNLMLTYDGAVKVIDFGIAKADTNSEATQAGTIKGKLSYLAPEYLDGVELDQRYDIFALGISMWEMLCMRKLFQASNDLAVLKQIQNCKVPAPSTINPNVPKELDAIVLKALSKERNDRYENMDQFNRALVRFLYANYPDFNATDLTHFSRQLFKEEIKKDEIRFMDYGLIDINPYINEMKKDGTRTGVSPQQTGTISKDKVGKIRELDFNVDNGDSNLELSKLPTMSADISGTRKLNKNQVPSLKVSSSSNSNHTGQYTRKTSLREMSRQMTVKKQKGDFSSVESSSSSSSLWVFVLTASVIAFAYFQPHIVEKYTGFNLYNYIHKKAGRNISSVNVDSAQDTKKGKLNFIGVDISMEIYIDGQKVDYFGTPLNISLGKEVSVLVKKSGYNSFKSKVITKDEISNVILEVPPLTKAKIGLLSSSLNYSSGSKLIFEVEGEVLEKELPLKDFAVPVGLYSAKIINPILGTEKKINLKIEENKRHLLE